MFFYSEGQKKRPRFNKNAAYEKELCKDEHRRLLIRNKRKKKMRVLEGEKQENSVGEDQGNRHQPVRSAKLSAKVYCGDTGSDTEIDEPYAFVGQVRYSKL